MNLLIIGGTSGFGAKIARQNKDANRKVLATGRDFNLHDGEWLARLREEAIAKGFADQGDPYFDVIVIAAVDRRNPQHNIQLSAALALYKLFSKEEVLFAMIGDMAHHYTPMESLYLSHKRAVYKQMFEWARESGRKCSLLLYEPWLVPTEADVDQFMNHVFQMNAGDFRCITNITTEQT